MVGSGHYLLQGGGSGNPEIVYTEIAPHPAITNYPVNLSTGIVPPPPKYQHTLMFV